MDCPHCGRELAKLLVDAPATVTVTRRVIAELEPSDLSETNLARHRNGRELRSFRLDSMGETLDDCLTFQDLELDARVSPGGRGVWAYCPGCNSELDAGQLDAWLAEHEVTT